MSLSALATQSTRLLVSPRGGGHASTCGYCGPPGQRSDSNSAYLASSLEAFHLPCDAYQRMIDYGWRRSGSYCYKPDLQLSCCPAYTIKLDALSFKCTRSQRKLINRWNRFVHKGVDDLDKSNTNKGKGNKPVSFPPLVDAIHKSEGLFCSDNMHRFDVTLESPSYSDEKYALYESYQRNVHKDRPTQNSPDSFIKFLVDSPLANQPIPYSRNPVPHHLPENFGSYHQMYRLDGKLFAMGVIDVLPACISSVYFIYDSSWERFSFGKLSALREVALAREIHDAGVFEMSYLYMGFYIHTCPKMIYKGDYSPSYLADPVTYEWFPLETCIPLLKKNRYACFSDPDKSIEGEASQDIRAGEMPHLSVQDVKDVNIVVAMNEQNVPTLLKPLTEMIYWRNDSIRKYIEGTLLGLTPELLRRTDLVFY